MNPEFEFIEASALFKNGLSWIVDTKQVYSAVLIQTIDILIYNPVHVLIISV